MRHNPVTVVLPGKTSWSPITIAFHCTCGENRRELVVHHGDNAHDIARYTRAIRLQHARGAWPPAPDTNPQWAEPDEEAVA